MRIDLGAGLNRGDLAVVALHACRRPPRALPAHRLGAGLPSLRCSLSPSSKAARPEGEAAALAPADAPGRWHGVVGFACNRLPCWPRAQSGPCLVQLCMYHIAHTWGLRFVASGVRAVLGSRTAISRLRQSPLFSLPRAVAPLIPAVIHCVVWDQLELLGGIASCAVLSLSAGSCCPLRGHVRAGSAPGSNVRQRGLPLCGTCHPCQHWRACPGLQCV